MAGGSPYVKYGTYLTYVNSRCTLEVKARRQLRRLKEHLSQLVNLGEGIMSAAVHFESYSEGRANLKALLDAAEQGRVATLRRDHRTAVVVDSDRMRHFLSSVVPSHASVVPENGGWSVFVPGFPVSADGNSFDEAIAEMIDALREYAEDWQARLRDAPNHREHWGIVTLIALSTDEQLQAWLVG